jgi:HK97 family phage portal protein
MSIKQTLAKWLTKDPIMSAALLEELKTLNAQWSIDDNYEKQINEGYLGNPYVYACINYIAKCTAGVSWQVKTGVGTDNESALDTHPLLELLKRPNPYRGRTRFMQEMISFLLTGGDCYIHRVGPLDITKPPKELYCLRPDKIKPISDGTILGVKYYERQKSDGVKEQIKPELILHLDFWSPLMEMTGPSPMRAGAHSIDQNNQGREWNVAALQNGARLSGLLSTDQQLDKASQERLEELVRTKFAGSKKAGQIMLAAGGLKWQDMGATPKDMDWLEGMKLSARETAIVYAVPPELVGDSSNKTYSNYQEARQAFYQETILPILDYLRDEFNNWLVPLYGDGVYIDYNSEDIEALQEDRDKVHARARDDFKARIITRNEARNLIGFEPLVDETSDTIEPPQPVINPSKDPDKQEDGKKALDPFTGKLPPMTPEEEGLALVMQQYFSDQAKEIVDKLEGRIQ